jgi:hypothetical protein
VSASSGGAPFATLGGALGLGVSRAAEALAGALRPGGAATGPVLVLGDDLARALRGLGVPALAVLPAPRRRRRKAAPRLVASPTALPFADGALDGALAAGMPEEGTAALRELARVVRDGGLVALATASSALVRKVAPPETLAASFMHASLIDIEQRTVGATLLTLGRVRRFG